MFPSLQAMFTTFYWSGQLDVSDCAWFITFGVGDGLCTTTSNKGLSWPVHAGNVAPVPVPADADGDGVNDDEDLCP